MRAGQTVSKTHPRIVFRGALDSLEADILETQLLAAERNEDFFRDALGEILLFTREIMSAEVNERPLVPVKLWGQTLDELHEQSHNVQGSFGFPHPVPDYTMGLLPVRLNTLRARVREVEIAAVRAFSSDTEQKRDDIVYALNRLSSAVYWLFCLSLSV
ncbi:MAG: hypothetical protein LBU85_05845 [Treponema sp.]|nr:hypothetical protein [Treponema sp.]